MSPAADLGAEWPSWHRNMPWDYLSPIAGLIHTLVPAYMGPDGDPLHPLASPLRGDLTGPPPRPIHVGDKELPQDQVVAFAERAQAAGEDAELVTGRDMVHVYPAFAGMVAAGDQAFVDAGEFMRGRVRG